MKPMLTRLIGPATLLLALAGCATTGPSGPGGSTDTPVAARTPTPQARVLPSGPMSELHPAELASAQVAPLETPPDLWSRIRAGVAMPDLDNDLVRRHEQWYASRPDYIQRMTDRSRKYLFHIVEELERRNMPAELALLPFIESAFNPQAVSSARAAGMWQFMPATGTYFDLKQNVFRDDRRSVLDSTRAALDYLQKLHGMFGDWHLALAAYNWGEGNVGRALARNRNAGQGTGYADLNMPDETRNYVPKLQAVKNIVLRPEQFSVDLPLIENHPYFQTVTIARDMDVAVVAKLADVPLADFKALNPQLNHPVVLAAGTPQILLPWDNATVFKRNLEDYNEGRLASWTAWSVPATMSVADAARRVGMGEQELRTVNNIPPRMLIKTGSVLIVPRNGTQGDVASHVADNGQLSLAPEVVTRRVTVRAGKRDTVATIARRHKVSAAQVADWNDVKPTAAFRAGETIVLHLPLRASAAGSTRVRARTVTPQRATASKPAKARAVARTAAPKAAASRAGARKGVVEAKSGR